MALVETIIGFLVSLLIGALGIYVGARVIADIDDYSYAIITALIGAVIWWLVAFFVPFIGSILALIAWIWLINARYPGGWGKAILIGIVAFVTVWVVQLILGAVGIIGFDALGVPSVIIFDALGVPGV